VSRPGYQEGQGPTRPPAPVSVRSPCNARVTSSTRPSPAHSSRTGDAAAAVGLDAPGAKDVQLDASGGLAGARAELIEAGDAHGPSVRRGLHHRSRRSVGHERPVGQGRQD
jgi:hypothetical protein